MPLKRKQTSVIKTHILVHIHVYYKYAQLVSMARISEIQ
jgi:hypothetical protein